MHAEQQVLDWLEWIEKNHAYARENLPGITQPRGFVVIGRTKGMSNEAITKLRFRNIFFGEKLSILTYDDLLQRAKSIQQTFQTL
ncbi:MAG: DUF4263 domain-containing protein [Ardenticatenaceae bacterium]|nr:DUF4263 domain-containing protein [Ardenticatenaceae bacterium]